MIHTIRMACNRSGNLVLLAAHCFRRRQGQFGRISGETGRAEERRLPKEYQKPPDGTVMIDCIVGGRFIWNIVEGWKGCPASQAAATRRRRINLPRRSRGAADEGVPESFVGNSFEFDYQDRRGYHDQGRDNSGERAGLQDR